MGKRSEALDELHQAATPQGLFFFVFFVCFWNGVGFINVQYIAKIKKSWTGKNVERLHREFPTVCQGLLYTYMGACVFACEGVSIVVTCCEGGRGRFRGGGGAGLGINVAKGHEGP